MGKKQGEQNLLLSLLKQTGIEFYEYVSQICILEIDISGKRLMGICMFAGLSQQLAIRTVDGRKIKIMSGQQLVQDDIKGQHVI